MEHARSRGCLSLPRPRLASLHRRRADEAVLASTVQDVEPDRETLRKLHQTIQKVTEDLDGMRFNTAIAAMMELTNHLTKLPAKPRAVLEPFVLLLSPFAPHLAEELWHASVTRRRLPTKRGLALILR